MTARRIAYDCEFIEGPRPDGVPTIDLISIGLVNIDQTAETLYRVSSEFDFERMASRPWLWEHVAPYLPIEWTPSRPNAFGGTVRRNPVGVDLTHPDVKPRATIAAEVLDFLTGPGEPVELWADYGAYDHVALHWLWGGMAHAPAGVPWYTNDIQQAARQLGVPEADLPKQTSGHHHALEDALYDARCVRYLTAVSERRQYRLT